MVDVCVGTSIGTITEPDCLGPCEPGTSVTLEGIVWHETEGGMSYLFPSLSHSILCHTFPMLKLNLFASLKWFNCSSLKEKSWLMENYFFPLCKCVIELSRY